MLLLIIYGLFPPAYMCPPHDVPIEVYIVEGIKEKNEDFRIT